MKKVLALVLMVGLAQGLYSEQQPTQYKYLNRLSKDSQIRQRCEGVSRAWFVKGDSEIACDLLDYSFVVYAQLCKDMYEKGFSLDELLSKLEKEMPTEEERDKAMSILNVDFNSNEHKELALLSFYIAGEENKKDVNNIEGRQFFEYMYSRMIH